MLQTRQFSPYVVEEIGIKREMKLVKISTQKPMRHHVSSNRTEVELTLLDLS